MANPPVKQELAELEFHCKFILFCALFCLSAYESREMVGGTSGKM
jgi:hypothetical protein